MAPSISIWYNLQYWKYLKITHPLDPMHNFKIFAHFLWKHLVGLKDTEAVRADLKFHNYKPTLWPIVDDEIGKITYMLAPWVLTKQEIHTVNERMRSIGTPMSYAKSLKNMFTMDDTALSGLKMHAWHSFIKVW